MIYSNGWFDTVDSFLHFRLTESFFKVSEMNLHVKICMAKTQPQYASTSQANLPIVLIALEWISVQNVTVIKGGATGPLSW